MQTNEIMGEQIQMQDLVGSYGRMSPEHSHREKTKTGNHSKAKTSAASSKKSSKSDRKMPLYLDLRGGGQQADVSWETGFQWLGDFMIVSTTEFLRDGNGCVWLPISTDSPHPPYYLTLDLGEKPNEPMPSKLSDLLEDEADPKYNLSATACKGILNRASRRGKALPPILKEALERQANEQAN